MSILSVSRLSKRYDAVTVLNDISFETREGEFISLLGPSGCGKSTTLRLIAGLDAATAGAIHLDGRDITGLPSAKRGVAMVFQSYALFPHLTVAQNIVFGLSVRGESRAAQRDKLAKVAPLLGLEKLLDRRPAQLSGGQQQRVALGRALVAEAPVCLLDEPLSNLDAKLRAEMRAEIRSLQQRLGITMIFVTHDQAEAMSMSDRVVLMRDGHIEQFGTPVELYARPETVFAASFIGAPPMNLCDGAALGEYGRNLPAGTVVGLRPEDIAIQDDGMPVTVEAIEYFGADSVLAVRFGDLQLKTRMPGHFTRHPGETISIGWPAAAVHLFDAQTGQRRVPSASPGHAAAPAIP
ncbi:ABC transporter ATP-binding protein [Martelella alba]|uniref:ABC transporter ATP-binding protein n=1 Tax=Martelella alba TaxID=2590451 RepID=A0A506U4Q7_9HYPH|nr:ABC transporter ATP-binding protein [Martelella alba]TPW28810.1 ABC transporter ATP-binding protein [Martelella alba]